MLTVPWTFVAALPGSVTVIAARLPARSLHALPPTLAWTCRLRHALSDASGVAGYAFAVQLSAPALWTVSAWTSRTELTAFEHSDAHEAAKAELRGRLRPATFVVWTSPADMLPVPWAEVRRRITVVT